MFEKLRNIFKKQKENNDTSFFRCVICGQASDEANSNPLVRVRGGGMIHYKCINK